VLLRGPLLDEAPGPDAEAPPPIMALRVMLAQASRIAVQARAPYVGTEHLVVAAFWADYARPLHLQGITYTQAAQQLTTLPRTEQTVDDGAIEPLTAVAVPTPAAANLADTARQLAELHPVQGDRRVSTLHHLLALSRHTAAATLLGELGVSYRVLVERLAADGARLVEADDQRPEEPPLEGWEAFEVTPKSTRRSPAGSARSLTGGVGCGNRACGLPPTGPRTGRGTGCIVGGPRPRLQAVPAAEGVGGELGDDH
jgi:Clp amino terminal domain, pathogenicity island component